MTLAGVHPQHPFFAEADTARVHIEPLSQVSASLDDDKDNNDDCDKEEVKDYSGVGDGVGGANGENDGLLRGETYRRIFLSSLFRQSCLLLYSLV